MIPLVSVVVTTHSGTNTIWRAVNSVLTQTYKNIEIIVVDDNGLGTEAQIQTEKIVKSFNDDRISYIPHKMNINGSAARNTGIAAAQGIYIALLDDDDAYLPEKTQKQVEALQTKPDDYAVCYTGMVIHFQNGSIRKYEPTAEGALFNMVMQRKIQAPSSVLMFTKDAAESINGFDTSFFRHQDWEFLDRISERYKLAVVRDVCLDRYIYRRNSAVNPKQFERNRIYYLRKMKPYFDKLSATERREAYYGHNKSILKEYMKERKILHSIQYFIRCRQPLRVIGELLRDYRIYSEGVSR